MNEEQDRIVDMEAVAQGSRQYKQVMGVTLLTAILVFLQELATWHALGFIISQAVLLCLVTFFAFYVGRLGRMRWGLFMAMLACGAHHFLLGGLYLTDPQESAVDPMCYWLAASGLLVVGLGCYLMYSLEIDSFFQNQRKQKP
jgi:FtsH-binding integral membrane protein